MKAEDYIMTLLKAIILGIIQGLTEFLPVSSSGHLAIFKELLHIQAASGASELTFDILLHIGTLVAICFAFHKDIKKMIVEFVLMLRDIFLNAKLFCSKPFGMKKEEKEYLRIINGSYRKFVLMVIVATIPTGIIGILLKDIVESISSSLPIVGVSLLITAVLLLIADTSENKRKTPRNIPYWQAAIVGVVQGIATIPGISRSGSTISACSFFGFDKKFAVRFSFIMSIPAILGALILDIKDIDFGKIGGQMWGYYVIGMVLAAVIGYFCIKIVNYLAKERKFKYFSIYCCIAGLVAIIGGIIIA